MAFTCCACGRTSHNLNDEKHGFCGACGLYESDSPVERVQLRRTEGWTMPNGVVRCDHFSPFANPFRLQGYVGKGEQGWWVETDEDGGRRIAAGDRLAAQALAVQLHRQWLFQRPQAALLQRVREVFRDNKPACYCAIGDPCHGDTLARVARVAAVRKAVGA